MIGASIVRVDPHPNTTEDAALFLSPDEYEFVLDCTPERRVRLAMRIEARCGPRAGSVLATRRGDFFIPDDPDVEIAFLRVRESKNTGDDDGVYGGSSRITWVPKDLYESVMSYCDDKGIGEDDLLFEIQYERLRQLIVETRENAIRRSGNEDYQYLASHDCRRYYATNMIRRERVNKQLVREMGDWNSHKAIEPYLTVSQPKDIQDGLARAGVLEEDVPAPPRQDALARLHQEVQELKNLIVAQETTGLDDLSMDLLERVKKEYEAEEAVDHHEDDGSDDVEYEQATLSTGLDESGFMNSGISGAGIAAFLGGLFSWRLRKEWLGFTDGGADWAPPRDLALGAVVGLGFLFVIAVNMAATGVWIDVSTLTVHASQTNALGLLLGSALGVIQVLYTDYRVRIQRKEPLIG